MRIDTARRTLIVGVLSALTLVANSALTPLGVVAEDLTIENTEKTNNLELDKLQKKFEELLGQENYNEALAVVKILQDKQIKTFGENHKTVASTYLDIGFLYFKKGLVEKSISALKNSRQILKSSLGSDHEEIVLPNTLLALTLEKQGDFEIAEPYLVEALNIVKIKYGLENDNTAMALIYLAVNYKSQHKYKKATPLFLRALHIQEASPIKTKAQLEAYDEAYDYNILDTLGFLALTHEGNNEYIRAEKVLKRALVLSQRIYGKKDILTADWLDSLAHMYERTGSFVKSEKLFLSSLRIRKSHANKESQQDSISDIYYGLGNIYYKRSEHSKAEQYYLNALKIKEAVNGLEGNGVAKVLSGLGLIYMDQALYEKAKLSYMRMLDIHRNEKDDEGMLFAMSGLSGIHDNNGEYEKAHALNIEILVTMRNIYGNNHRRIMFALNNLGKSFERQRKYREAETLHLESLAIARNTLPLHHPLRAYSLKNLILNYELQGRSDLILPLLRASLESDLLFVQREAPVMLRQERQKFLDNVDQSMYNRSFSLALKGGAKEVGLALFARLNRHGLLEELEKRQSEIAALTTEQRELVKHLQEVTDQLSSLSIKSSERDQLQIVHDDIELELYRALPSLSPRVIETQEVAKTLSEKSVLIEYQKYYTPIFDNRGLSYSAENERYMAILLAADGSSTAIDLGPAEVIDQNIQKALSDIESRSKESNESLSRIYKLIINPLNSVAKDFGTWIISPDAEINRVPFSALRSDEYDKYLSEIINIRLVTTGRELLPSEDVDYESTKVPLILADPGYGVAIETSLNYSPPKAEANPAVLRSSALSNRFEWDRLEATAKEGLAVEALIGGELLMQDSATVNAVKSYGATNILHLATHAFYLPNITNQVGDDSQNKPKPLRTRGSVVIEDLRGESPLLRSGIVLTGANKPNANPKDDGYLTALEIAQLNWHGTELVVISACESGLGDIRAGEGVYGLKRSISVAGARSSLLSLWKVDDAATAAFMESFYKRLKSGEGIGDALASTQAEFRDHPIPLWREPYVWAAFQLSGDWGPIKFR